MPLLEPDRYFSRLSHIDIDRDLLARGLGHVLLDIDNTILTRDTHEVPRDVRLWLGRAQEAGVTFCLVSNNWHKSVFDLAQQLDIPIVAKAVKPLPHGFMLGMNKLKSNRKNTVMVGDQLMTDVFGAHLLGMRAYLLCPLVEQDLPHTLVIRNLERAIMGERQPEPAPARCQHTERKSR
ncbi:MAG: YqeG family HAD IIIA-type phosphatase [Eggerthellaceae bacterium]|nr:YqeG family HAD IIIA-type phosphatase [Eggerthellaceae bacterium]